MDFPQENAASPRPMAPDWEKSRASIAVRIETPPSAFADSRRRGPDRVLLAAPNRIAE
jgi:hypothetical protein